MVGMQSRCTFAKDTESLKEECILHFQGHLQISPLRASFGGSNPMQLYGHSEGISICNRAFSLAWCHSAIITATSFFKLEPPQKKQQKSWVGVISPKMTLKFKRTRLSPTKMRSGGSRLGENEPEMVFPDTDANDGKHGDAVDAVDVFKHGQFGSFGLGLHGIGACGWMEGRGKSMAGGEGSHRFNGKWWSCYVLVIPEDVSFFCVMNWDDFFFPVYLFQCMIAVQADAEDFLLDSWAVHPTHLLTYRSKWKNISSICCGFKLSQAK